MLILHSAVPDKLTKPTNALMVVVVLTDVPEISRVEEISPLVVKEQTAVPDRFSTIPSVNSPDVLTVLTDVPDNFIFPVSKPMVDTTLTDVPLNLKVTPKAPVVDVVFADVPDNFSVIPSVSSPVVLIALIEVPDKSKVTPKLADVLTTLTAVPDKL